MLVVGIPNVGKSSLINIMRNQKLKIKGRATSVGNLPGVTRSVLTKIRVSNDPIVYLIDTPGIMMPNIKDMEVGMKLALCATLHDHMVGESYIADYLLYFLNKQSNFSYVDYMKLDGPTDDVRDIYRTAAAELQMYESRPDLTKGHNRDFPNILRICEHFIRGFREGKLGQINLDCDLIDRKLRRSRKQDMLNKVLPSET